MMDSNNSGYASGQSQSASWSSPRYTGERTTISPAPHHAFRRLQTRQQYLPLLIATTVVTLLLVIATGYVAARASAINTAEATASTDAQIAREVISERGQYPAIVNNQLVADSGTNTYALVNDTWVVDHVQQLTGEYAAIYQMTGATSLTAVATNLPRTDGQGHAIANTRADHQPMPVDARAVILGACGPANGKTACNGDYSGTVTIDGASYVAGFEPLLDQNGHLVGAVGVLRPLDDVLTAPMQLAIVLLLMSLLVGLVAVVVGTWLAGRFPNQLLRQLDSQLDTMAAAAVELGRLAHQQQFRLQHQQRTARQIGDHAMKLEALSGEMDEGQTALHQTATAIWEQMSQPGVAINAAMALHLAREAAVRASEVGVAGDATRAHARQVITLMNRVIAESRVLAEEGQEAETHANEMAATLERMETDLGEHLVTRRYDLGSAPLVRRITGVSQRLRQRFQSGENRPTQPNQSTGRPSAGAGRTGGAARGTGQGWSTNPGPLSGLPQHDDSGRYPSAPLRGNDSLHGFPPGDRSGRRPPTNAPANPDGSGSRQSGRGSGGRRGGRDGRDGIRPPGDASPPGGLPPLGRFDGDIPPRGPNDSHWLNE